METTTDLLFLLAVTFLFNHELDAVQQHEWRILSVPLSVSDKVAYRIFVAFHILFFGVIIWYINESWLQIGLDVFLIAHVFIHYALRNNSNLVFTWFSWVWILGGGILGAIHLLLMA